MNKKKYNRLALLAFIMSLLALSGCNGSGDETISLEYGNAKKMVVGQWILSDMTHSGNSAGDFVFSDWKPGTWLAFYDDGTYSDSSDGGKTPHRWVLSGTPDGSTPYYGGIDLDDKEFGIGNLGPGRWILEYPKGSGDGGLPGWELGLDKGDDDPGPKTFEPVAPEPEPEPEPEPVVEKRYLVKEINSKHQMGNYQSSKSWYFSYDDKDRIEQFWCVLNDYNRKEFTSKYSYTESSVNVENDAEGSFIGYFLDSSDLRIKGFKRTNWAYEVNYRADGYISGIGTVVEIQYIDGNLASLNGNIIDNQLFRKELNDANIDLNCFISGGGTIDSYFSHVPIFEPFGFYGKRSKNLMTNNYKNIDVKRDDHGNIVTIHLWDDDQKTKTLTISYEERINEIQ